MKKFMKKGLTMVLVLTLLATILVGCSSDSSSSGDDSSKSKETVKLVYVNWSEGIAMTNLAKAILEEKMGYEVEMSMADVAPIFTSLSTGDQDVFMDAWLPVTHASYWDKYGDDIEDLGTNFEGAKIGLVVPAYMDIDTIEELNDMADELDGEIVGIDAGAGIMSTTETAIKTYGLDDLKLVTGSGPAMTASLDAAIKDKEPIVVTGWEPHWMFAKYDLKFLEDSKGVYGDSEDIHTLTRTGFSDDMPEVAEFFKNFFMTSQELGDLMGAIADSDEEADVVAKKWMEEHEELVDSWIPAK